ncbi:uncharacterized protein LOC115981048 [Quercus lobata]|uniref:uncharacterized protein LOC115981048 n=1 Tax=Quercus lobata TaxID=97700 RepID=UPI00124642E3|nr:uncharacterized protein LOC115981048 [Quercus lobata]
MLHEELLMDNASLRDFRGSKGIYVADVLERSLVLPTDMAELGNLRRQEAVQATYRLEEDAKEQSKSLELERDKRLDTTWTLKNSEADLSKLKIGKEQIVDLKKKLAEAEGAKNVAEWARDEALRAKAEAEFARTEAESSKEKAKEEAYDLGVAETQATLKAQVLGVCRLYYSQVWNEVLKQAGVEASSDLWKVANVYYPLAIHETAAASSEAEVALEEAEAARSEAALAITTHNEPVEEGELPGATETHENLDPEAPQKTAESTADAQALHAEEPALSDCSPERGLQGS